MCVKYPNWADAISSIYSNPSSISTQRVLRIGIYRPLYSTTQRRSILRNGASGAQSAPLQPLSQSFVYHFTISAFPAHLPVLPFYHFLPPALPFLPLPALHALLLGFNQFAKPKKVTVLRGDQETQNPVKNTTAAQNRQIINIFPPTENQDYLSAYDLKIVGPNSRVFLNLFNSELIFFRKTVPHYLHHPNHASKKGFHEC